jgi:hypothetical protein
MARNAQEQPNRFSEIRLSSLLVQDAREGSAQLDLSTPAAREWKANVQQGREDEQ